MELIRRNLAAIASVLLLGGVGAGALAITSSAHDAAEDVHAEDRVTLQRTLAALTNQYLLFTAAESFEAASRPGWSLEPGDPADTARLEAFVDRAQLVNHGAALVALDATRLNAWSDEPGLPDPDDPGYEPLRQGLLAGKPGVSDLMMVDGTPVVAVGVPITVGGAPRAVLVGFTRTDTSPLQEYAAKVTFDETGLSYVLDRTGFVVASADPSMIGHRLRGPADPDRAVGEGFAEFDRDGEQLVASFSPVDTGGWTAAIEQSEQEFFTALRDGRTESATALATLLAAAVIGMVWLAQKWRGALDNVEHQAFHDPLTDLANRTAFRTRLDEALARARRTNEELAVLFVDLDDFKQVNDSLGHDAGDSLIQEVADRLRSCVREVDMLARIGGDEFTVVLEGVHHPSEAIEVSERINRSLQVPMRARGETVIISASVGIALSDGADAAEAVLRDADLAMYFAKDTGRARHAVFHHGRAVPLVDVDAR